MNPNSHSGQQKESEGERALIAGPYITITILLLHIAMESSFEFLLYSSIRQINPDLGRRFNYLDLLGVILGDDYRLLSPMTRFCRTLAP